MKVLNVFKYLWRLFTGDRLRSILQNVDRLVGVALPVVEEIAALTPTRTDDEILALFKRFRVEVEGWLGLPQDQRGAALMHVATQQLQRLYPALPVNEIQSAIQLAVTISKNK